MIKPDSTADGNGGNILALLEKAGFRIVGMKKLQLTTAQAEAFYAAHKERPFYGELVEFMTQGPITAACLEREKGLREVMGATNPADAAEGTVRKLYATNIQNNAIHGSDSPENAAIEIGFFFSELELVG